MALIALYKLDGDPNDSLAAYTGSTSGTVTYLSGKINESALFAPGRIDTNLPDSSTGNMSFSVWFKKNSSNWALSIGVAGTRNGDSGWMLYRNSGDTAGYFRWYMHYNTTSATVSTYYAWPGISGLTDGVWYHFVVTRGSTGTSKIYVNGVKTTDLAAPANFSSWRYTAVNLGIGAERAGSGSWNANDMELDEFRFYDHVLTDSEAKSLYEARASFKNNGDFLIRTELNETKFRPLTLNYTTWTTGSGSTTGFNQNGSTAENERISALDPWGKTTVIWETRPLGDNNADGGWNTSQFDIDITKLYRYSVWVKRITTTSSGNLYLGIYGYNSGGSNIGMVRMDGGGSNTNSYWDCPGIGSLPYNEWVLIVGHVYPSTESGTGKHPDTGRWNLSGIKFAATGCNIGTGDIKWDSTHVRSLHRTYHFYSTTTAAQLQFAYPRVDIVDGNEPTVQDLIAGVDSIYLDYISSVGATTNMPLSIGNNIVYITNIDEYTGTSSTQQFELDKDGCLYINGEISEVD